MPGPVAWQDLPSTTTPITAANLLQMQQWVSDQAAAAQSSASAAATSATASASSATTAAAPTSAAIALLNQRGLYSARPAANSVNAGTMYFPTDIPEQYRSNGSIWEVVGSGGNELGYAQITAATAAQGPALADVPGLSITFVAGERPVEVAAQLMALVATTGIYIYPTLVLDGAVVSQQLRRTNVAGEYVSLLIEARLPAMTGGSSHTIKLRAQTDSGTLTPQGATTNPSWISVKTR